MLPVRRQSNFGLLDLFNRVEKDFFNFDDYFFKDVIDSHEYLDKETGQSVAEVSVQGFKKDEISIELEQDLIRITGNKDESNSKWKSVNNFNYVKYLSNVDPESIVAKIEDGILELRWKYKDKVIKQIEIQ